MARKKTQQRIVAAIEGAREGAAGEIGRIVADMTGKKTKGRSGMGGGYTGPIPGEKLPPEPPPPPFTNPAGPGPSDFGVIPRPRPAWETPNRFWPTMWESGPGTQGDSAGSGRPGPLQTTPPQTQPEWEDPITGPAPPTGIDPQGDPNYRPISHGPPFGQMPSHGPPFGDAVAKEASPPWESPNVRGFGRSRATMPGYEDNQTQRYQPENPPWESPNVRGFGRSRAITPGYEDNQTQRYAYPMPGDPSSDVRHRRIGRLWRAIRRNQPPLSRNWPFSGGGGGGRGNTGDHYSSFGPKPVPSFFPGMGAQGGRGGVIKYTDDWGNDAYRDESGTPITDHDTLQAALRDSQQVGFEGEKSYQAASAPANVPPPDAPPPAAEPPASLPDFVSTDTGIQLDAMPVSAAGTDVPGDAYSLVRGERDPGSGQEYEAWQNPTGDWFRRWMGQDAPPPPAAAVDPNVPAEGEYDFDVTGAGYTDAELLAAQAGTASTGASETNYQTTGTHAMNAGWLRARMQDGQSLGLDTSDWYNQHPQAIQDMINNRRGQLPGGAYGNQAPVGAVEGPAPAPPSPPSPASAGSPPSGGNEQSLLAIRTMLEQLMANQQPEPTQPWNPATGPAQGYDPGFTQAGLPKNYATMWNTPMAGSTMAPGSPWRTDTRLQVLPHVQKQVRKPYYAHPLQRAYPTAGAWDQMEPGAFTQYLDQFRPSGTYGPTYARSPSWPNEMIYSPNDYDQTPADGPTGPRGGGGAGGHMQGAGGYMQGAGESRFAPPGYMGGGMGGHGEENGYGGGRGPVPFDAQGGIDAFVTALEEIIANIGDPGAQQSAWAMLAQSASGDFASLIAGMYGLTGQLYSVDQQAALAMEGLTQQAGQFAAGLGLDIFGQQQAGAISGYQSETARMGVAGQLQAIAAELGMGATIEAAIADQDYDIAARQIQAAIEQIYSQERLGLTQIDSGTRIAMTNAYNTASQIESSERVSMANVGMQGTLGLEGIAQGERGNRTGFIGQAMNSPGAMIPVLNALRNPETMGDFDPWAMARTTPWGNMYQGIPGMVQAGQQAGVGQPSPAAMNMQSNMGQPSPDPDFTQAFSQARDRELAQAAMDNPAAAAASDLSGSSFYDRNNMLRQLGQPSQKVEPAGPAMDMQPMDMQRNMQMEPAGTAMNAQSFYDPNNMLRQLDQPSQVEPAGPAMNAQSDMQNIQSNASAASLPSFNSMSLVATPAEFAASVPDQSQLSQTGTGTNFPTTQEPVNVMPNIAAPDWMNMLEPERNIYARALGSFYPDFEEEQNAIVGTGVGPDRAIFAGV